MSEPGRAAHAAALGPRRAIRAASLDCTSDPFRSPDAGGDCPPATDLRTPGLVAIPDALVVIGADGRIEAHGPAALILPTLPPELEIEDRRGQMLVPGFVDAHLHAPQLGIVGAGGYDLLGWLQRFTFPIEAGFADEAVARAGAALFCEEMLRQGTTSAVAFATIHAPLVDFLFEEAAQRGMRLVAGRVMMDRNAPPALADSVEQSVRDTEALIARWHGRGRALYAVSPRFAPTSSPEGLEAAAALWRSRPGLVLQSHLAETEAEIAWVRQLFPEARDYTDVYARFGLLGARALYGHGIHLAATERRVLAETGTTIVHCPTSNLFLGSGLCDVAGLRRENVPVALATDIGAGTSTSMLRTMAAAIDVARMRGDTITPGAALWLATRAGAAAIGLPHEGGLEPGMTADIVALDPEATPLLAFRTGRSDGLEETLGALQTLGDDRCVAAVWCAGRQVKGRSPAPILRAGAP